MSKTPEEIAALETERKIINMTGVISKDDDGNVIEKKEDIIETKDDADNKSSVEESSGEKKEEEIAIEKPEKTEEELETEKVEAKTVVEKARIQRKIDKEIAKRKTLEEQLLEANRKLAEATAGKEGKYDEDEVEKRAEAKATQKAAEREFLNASNRLAEAAEKIDKDFIKKIKTVAEDTAPIPGHMIGILDDLDNGGAVLVSLADDVDEYERIIGLSPAKAAVELTKLSVKISTKPAPKPVSKVPKPIEPIGGSNSSTNNDMTITDKDTKNMNDFIRKRNIQIAERAKLKAAGYRGEI
jgi:hypothetical protein